MTWPLQPIGPRPDGPPRIDPVDRPAATDRRRSRSDDEPDERGREGRKRSDGPPVADDDGHIDVLA
jgi:hypothetical protein